MNEFEINGAEVNGSGGFGVVLEGDAISAIATYPEENNTSYHYTTESAFHDKRLTTFDP